MPEIKPFSAIRFDHRKTNGDLSNLLAPPYDVLDQADKDALLAGSDRNIVAIDLPHLPPKSAGPAEVYEKAGRTLEAWLKEGVLIQEATDALYLYHQKFTSARRSYTRRKFIARVRLAPFSERTVLPHERTFGGPKEDRLALMKATRCQLSPIFGLYADPEDRINAALAATAQTTPDATATLDGVENQMWVVTDGDVVKSVTSEMADKKIYIADGHHRYGTALLYRDWLAGELGGSLPSDHPANYIMFVLAGMDDPGCLILPYHRAIVDVDLKTIVDAWKPGTEPARDDQADIVLFEGSTAARVRLRYSDRAKLRTLEPNECEPWFALDYAYLHRYLIDELLKSALGADPKVRYVKSAERAETTARQHSGVALLVNATPMEHLRAVSEAGGLMPQKSTYFYPKLATGVTINPLT